VRVRCRRKKFTFVISSPDEFLVANVNVRDMLSPVRLFVICLPVTLVHPTQVIEIFGNVSTSFGTFVICDLSV